MGLKTGGAISSIFNLISAVQTDPVYYVDPVTGLDTNTGTITSPLLTINEAQRRLSFGFYGFATINLRAGTHTMGNRIIWPQGLASASATAGGVLINGVDNTDSGLGARTAAGGTTGATVVFGTVIDSVGGLVVNAHRGRFLRFTSGATLNGRSFVIVSNTANTFTVAGTIPVAPTVETFVVETPGATITWAGSPVMQAAGGVAGFQNVAFSGAGGANGLFLTQIAFGTQRCTFANLGSQGIRVSNGAVLTDVRSIQNQLGSTSIVQQCGAVYTSVAIGLGVTFASGAQAGGMVVNRSLFNNSPVETISGVTIQLLNSYLVGNSYVRASYSGTNVLFSQVRFDAVTPPNTFLAAMAGAFGGALVVNANAMAYLVNVDIANTPATFGNGDAIVCEDGGRVGLNTVTGAGNAGVGVRLSRGAALRAVASTVTGAGGDYKVGALAAGTWVALTPGVFSADPTELCLASNFT